MPFKNPEKQRAAYRKYNATDKGKHRVRKFWRQRYGMTDEQYHEMMKTQEGKCAICGTTFTDKPRHIHIDHCHSTGKVRGLLCKPCNQGLGMFKDDPALLKAAAYYVETQ